MADLDARPCPPTAPTPHVDDRERGAGVAADQPENVHLFRGFGPLVVGVDPVRAHARAGARRSRPSTSSSEPVDDTTTDGGGAVIERGARAAPQRPRRAGRRSGSSSPTRSSTGCRARPLPDGDAVGRVTQGVIFGTSYALLAMGLILIYRTTRIVNFAYGAMGAMPGALTVGLFVGQGLELLASPSSSGMVVGIGVRRRWSTSS